MSATLWTMFFTGERLPDAASNRIETSARFGGLKQDAGHADASVWSAAPGAIGDGLRQMMQISITDLGLKAWARHQELRKAVEGAGPGKIVVFDLGEHAITSKHKPRMDLVIAGRTVGSLEFDLTLRLDLKAVRLQIQDRRVTKVTSGACQASGTLKLGDVELSQIKSKEFDLPGAFEVHGGMPLPFV